MYAAQSAPVVVLCALALHPACAVSVHTDLQGKTATTLRTRMQVGDTLATVEAARYYDGPEVNTYSYIYCPGLDGDKGKFRASRKALDEDEDEDADADEDL